MNTALFILSIGEVLVWQNGLDFPLVHRYYTETKINCLHLGQNTCSVISSSASEVRIDTANKNGVWTNLYSAQCDKQVSSFNLLLNVLLA